MSKTVFAAVAVLAMGSFNTYGQLSQGVIAKVPFDFTAGYKNFPAGEYRVFAPSPGVIAVRSIDGRTNGFVVSQRTESVKTQETSKLVFNRYGDQYFLSQIWIQGDNAGGLLKKTPAELEAADRSGQPRTQILRASKSRR